MLEIRSTKGFEVCRNIKRYINAGDPLYERV